MSLDAHIPIRNNVCWHLNGSLEPHPLMDQLEVLQQQQRQQLAGKQPQHRVHRLQRALITITHFSISISSLALYGTYGR